MLDALIAYAGDVSSVLDQAQGYVDSAPPGKCQDKAQKILDKVNEEMAAAGAAPDYKTLVKYLGKAAKDVLKGMDLAEAALECGLPNNLPWYISTLSMTINGVPTTLTANAMDPNTGQVGAFLEGQQLSVSYDSPATQTTMYITYDLMDYPNGPYPVYGQLSTPDGFYIIDIGTGTLQNLPNLPEHVSGTFEFDAYNLVAPFDMVEVTNGSFTAWTYDN